MGSTRDLLATISKMKTEVKETNKNSNGINTIPDDMRKNINNIQNNIDKVQQQTLDKIYKIAAKTENVEKEKEKLAAIRDNNPFVKVKKPRTCWFFSCCFPAKDKDERKPLLRK